MNRDCHFFLHVDLDGLWTLPACYGYPEGTAFTDDPVFTLGVERLLALMDEAGLRASVFIIGRDLELPAKAAAVARLAAAGHALANHSHAHDLALELRPEGEILADIARAQTAIGAVAGRAPLGFRAPGYGAGPRALAAAVRAGLRYDGSLFPSPLLGPLLRRGMAAFQRRAHRAAQREFPGAAPHPPALGTTFGGAERAAFPGARLADRWRLEPYQVRLPDGGLWRLPVAVTPVWRLPLQASLGINLGARRVAAACARLGRRAGAFTWLLHGMDVLGPEDLAGRLPAALAGSRAFNIPLERRLAFIRETLALLKAAGRPALAEEWLAEKTERAR